MPEGSAIISFQSVSLIYRMGQNCTHALDSVNFEISPETFAALVGPSGCGKTTLLKLVAGLMIPDQGEIWVGGEKVARPLKIVGMAFQNPSLLPWRTVLGNVLLPLEIVQPYAKEFHQKRKEYIQHARELLAMVGLEDFENHYPWQLSGGMQQRVSLCRALIHSPKILLLDEPFGALDAFTREELWLVLQRIWLKLRPTVLLVTHDLREAVFLAHIVYVMSNRPGRILREEPVDFPHPRELELSYTPAFTELVHTLRKAIIPEPKGKT